MSISSQFINSHLKNIYEPFLSNLKQLTFSDGQFFSFPILMKAFSDYEKANRRVLYVGKETHGWIDTMNNSKGLTVEYLMNCYQEFEFAKNYQSRNSPFWRFVHKCNYHFNDDVFANGFLWTNFSKCDSFKKTPSYELQQLNNKGFDLILDEIKIVNPNVVVFLTGWSFENQFQRVFNGIEYKTILENYLYQCIHPNLPTKSYVTMHPKGLQIRSMFENVYQKIIEEVNKN